MSKDNGGSAYPFTGGGNYSTGMTLRDYFAAQAMAGYAATGKLIMAKDISDATLKERAKEFYRMADAMIAAR